MPQLFDHNNAPSLRKANESPPASCNHESANEDFNATLGGSTCSDGSAMSSCSTSDAECDDRDDHVRGGANPMGGGTMSMCRTKSVYTFNLSTLGGLNAQGHSCAEDTATRSCSLSHEATLQQTPLDFSGDVCRFRAMHQGPDTGSDTDATTGAIAVRGAAFRDMLEPHLRHARISREQSRLPFAGASRDPVTTSPATYPPDASLTHYRSIADSVGVPYIALRQERAFLFDEHSYPLHHLLAQALHVDDLTRLHERGIPSNEILPALLRDKDRCRAFHAAYDGFVTTFCVPLIHSLAITKNVFHSSSSDQITYRYQAFPTVRVVQPGDAASPPVCDTVLGHSIGCLHFCIPLTPSVDDENSPLYVESHPGREDWHPLQTRAFGLGFQFDGARCLYFDLGGGRNRTSTTVSLQFRVLLYREPRIRNGVPPMSMDDELCPVGLVEDRMSRADPSFYEEAVVDMGRNTRLSYAANVDQLVVKKHGDRLLPVSVLVQPRPSVVVG